MPGHRFVRVTTLVLAAAACSGKSAPPANSCDNVPAAAMVPAWTADPHYCVYKFAEVAGARGQLFAPNGDLFVATNNGQIVVLFDSDGDGLSGATERATFVAVPGGNHGIALTATHLYASSDTTVYRWSYTTGQRVAAGAGETVVHGIEGGGHSTRTLVIDSKQRLYVSIGSASNVDAPPAPDTPSATRAVLRRYDLTALPAGGFASSDGELFAAGLRNEVGLSIDSHGRLWGVENGRDALAVGGADIHFDNPGEELNRFDLDRPGRNYGYPFCWSEGLWTDASAKGPGTQHLDPDQPGAFTEARCQDETAVVPPAFVLPAHIAPLGVVAYEGAGYPSDLGGNLFVASHGSWNREIGQVGRLIFRLRMNGDRPVSAEPFLGQADTDGGLAQGVWTTRPVSIAVDGKGLLTFTDDAGGSVNKIGYRP
jgi:glucose/arabinose dehydrogenase